MSNAFIDDFVKRLIASGIASDDDPLIGCSEEELSEIEQKLQVKLPSTYRALLLKMGRQAGDFLRGEEHSYPELLTLKNDARELLEDSNTSYRLSPTDFVFWMSQGTQFSFFDTAEGDDPPVFHYREDDPAPVKRHDHLSQALDYMLEQDIVVRDHIKAIDDNRDQ